MSLTSDVKSILTAAGISAASIQRGRMLPTPDNAIAVYPTGGYPRSLSGTEVEEPTFMVKVRNADFDAGETMCNTVKDALHGAKTSKLLMIEQQGDTQVLGYDQNNRAEFTLNFRCYYRR